MKDPKLTKSLFVEFTTNPHIAWWHLHDPKGVYEKINEKLYGEMDGLAVGKAAEDQVLLQLQGKNIINIEKIQRKHPDRYQGFHNNTIEAIEKSPDVIYQPAFLFGNLFVKCDFLVKNDEGTYDLREVKSKNGIRKKSKAADLLDDLQADVSFQNYMMKKVLKEKYSGRVFMVYLNKEYVKNGPINPHELLLREEVTNELKKDEAVENIVKSMSERLKLEREEFIKLYPYDGDDHLMFFGKESEKGSIWRIPQIRNRTKEFYELGKILIDHFTEDERAVLFAANGEETKSSQYVSLRQQGEKVVNKEGIRTKMEQIAFPIFFYDYETICWPVPLIEGTSPRQQVVVQYSVHRMDADGTISHREAIIGSGATTNKTIVDELVKDLDGGNGTFVVRFKGFENSRNDEMGQVYPEHAEIFAKINENTFDLMEIFSEQLYFHRGFQGSSSLKKVLPIMTDLSYEHLAVPHGSLAAELLKGIVTGEHPLDLCDKHIKNLLEYCKQDTRAMVCIYQKVLEEIKA